MAVWCWVFLGLRLYDLMFMGEVFKFILFFPLSIFIMLLVCPARFVWVGGVSGGGFMVWATCWL